MGMEAVFRLSVVLSLMDKMTSPLSSATGGFQKASKVMTAAGAGIVTACTGIVTSTFETQNALGELSSLGVKDLKAVESAAKSFSDTWAGTTKSDFITAAYDIKSGIASLSDEGIAQFTELAALTGKATKSTTQEMGSLFATGYGIYKGAYKNMSDLQFGEMFSAGISTAVKNYKTAGSQMASAISVLGATATNNKVSMEEQLAILGQLQTTMSGSEAATKYKAFLNAAASAGGKLKTSFVDSNGELLSTTEIIEKLHKKYGQTISAIEKQELKQAFGTDEAVAMIDLLYNNVDVLKGGIDNLSASMKKGVSVTKEMATAINSTPEQKFKVIQQQIHNNVEELGNALLPIANDVLTKVGELVAKWSAWTTENRATVETIVRMAAVLGPLLIILGSAIGIIIGVSNAIIKVKTAFAIAQAAVAVMKAKWVALNITFAISPIGLIIIGIIALVAAFAILWNKSEAFRNFWKRLFSGIVNVAKNSINAVKNFFGNIMGAASATVKEKLNNIKNAYKANGGGIKGIVAAYLEAVKGFFTAGFTFIDKLTGGKLTAIKDKFFEGMNAAGNAVKGALDGIKNWFSEKLTAVKNFFGSIMGAASATVKEKLNNIKNAYKANGGGIKGIVAAYLEAVKGYFTAGFTFIDNLTGGKLTAIKDKFMEGMNAAGNAVKGALDGIKNWFTEKLTAVADFVKGIIDKIKGFFGIDIPTPKIKLPHFSISGEFSIAPPSVPSLSIDWYAKGGVMTKPTIFGASGGKLLGGGEAGDEAILPLSALWEKLSMFIRRELKDKDNDKESGSVITSFVREGLRNLRVRSSDNKEKETRERQHKKESGNTIIQKLEITLNLEKLKDLPTLFKLIDELKDAQNSKDKPKLA